MRVIERLGRVTYPDGGYHEIQFGVATWEGDNQAGEMVVRAAYYAPDGRFNPRSSAEIPNPALLELVREAISKGLIERNSI